MCEHRVGAHGNVHAHGRAVLLGATVHGDEAAPLIGGGIKGGVDHTAGIKDVLLEEGGEIHARGLLDDASHDVERPNAAIHLLVAGVEAQIGAADVVHNVAQILHILGGHSRDLALAQLVSTHAVGVVEQDAGGELGGGLLHEGEGAVLLQLTDVHLGKCGEVLVDGLVEVQKTAADLNEGRNRRDGLGHGSQTENRGVAALGEGLARGVGLATVIFLVDGLATLCDVDADTAEVREGGFSGDVSVQALGKLLGVKVSHSQHLLCVFAYKIHCTTLTAVCQEKFCVGV